MYALINTMNSIPGDSPGTILSQHRTLSAAERAAARLQRIVEKSNGKGSYLPTIIVKLTRKPRGRYLCNDEFTFNDV